MYREPQQSVDTSDTQYEENDADMLINNLIYSMPKSMSVCVNRTHVQQFPTSMSNVKVGRDSVLIWDWNTGNNYIDCSNSYLKFRLKATATTALVAPPTFGVFGSALNLFKEVRIRSRSGTELNRTENANLLNNYLLQYSRTQNYIDTIGSAFYLNSTVSPFNTANTLISEISIPLSLLDSFFRPLKGVLIPSQLSSGLHIEISLESIARAFKDPAGYFGAGALLEMIDISMMLDSSSLSDDTSRLMNLESSNTGLEYCYTRNHNVNSIYPLGTNNINLQISKAVSQATQIFTIISNAANSNLSTVDSFVSEGYKVSAWGYRLGSSYYPNQPILDNLTGSINGVQSFLMAMSSFEKMKNPFQESSMTLNKFQNSLSVLSVDLQRNQSLQVSGQASNNSRLLELNMTRNGAADTDKIEVNAFLSYISVCRTFIDNASVAI